MFFLQEFDTKIKDNNGVENLVADHFSRIEGHVDPFPVMDNIHNERLMHLHSLHVTPWFADNVNFIVAFFVPPHASRSQIDNLKCNAKYYVVRFYHFFLCCYEYILIFNNYNPSYSCSF